MIISCKHPNPQFEGQTKTKLGNIEVRKIASDIFGQGLERFLMENPAAAKVIVGQVNIQIAVDRLGLGDSLTRHQGSQSSRDLHRRAAQGLGQLEARESNVAHGRIGGIFQKPQDVLGGHLTLGSNGLHTCENPVSDQGFDLKHHSVQFLSLDS